MTRAEASPENPLLKEAYWRDALRVEPGNVTIVAALMNHYRTLGMAPLDRALATYGNLLDPGGEPWSDPGAQAGDENAAPADWIEQDELAYEQVLFAFEQQRYLDAAISLRNLLQKHSGHLRLAKDLATLYLQVADWPMATAMLAWLHEQAPDDLNVANDLAVCWSNLGRPDLVLAVLERMLANRPEDVYLLRNLSISAEMAGQQTKAIDYARRRAELEPLSEEAEQRLKALMPTSPEEVAP